MAEPPASTRGPHVALVVRRERRPGGIELDFTLDSDSPEVGFVHRRFGGRLLELDPAAELKKVLRRLGDRPVETREQQRNAEINLQATGAWLYERLLPPALGDTLRSLVGRATSLEIVSEETTIPWELMCPPRRASDESAGPFLGEAFVVTRWLSEARPVEALPLERIAVVVAGDSGLPSAEQEKQGLMARARPGVRRIEEVPSRYAEVVGALGSGVYDGWHFIGHGSASGSNADEWQIELRRNEPLSPYELGADARGLGRAAPLVFLNACETGQGGISLTGVGGWASGFLAAGAGAFIAPLWAVRDERASVFAADFYDAFLGGLPIGEALQQARLGFRRRYPGDPTWLAYVVYARPQATCAPAVPVAAGESAAPAPRVAPADPPEGEPATTAGERAAAVRRRDAAAPRAAAPAAPAEPSRPSTPRPGEERLHEADGSVLLYVPGGDYPMGAEDVNDWTRPVHRVRLAPFWIARHPVTNEQYARFLAAHPTYEPPEFWQDERFDAPRQPVVGVSWDDAEAYCRWVGLALPSEAQWEAAARGPEGRTYPWGDEPPEPRHANFGGRLGATSPVDAHPDGRGPFGTFD
ncbi:MAG TPA: SUMF1/EgtB/PvdO family nonheme iron enzyme, partial [Thermoanaerobaculia bacterium]